MNETNIPLDELDGALDTGTTGTDGAVEIDFSTVTGLEPLPAGKYNMQCVSAKMSKSKQGQPLLQWSWRVMDGEFAKRQVIDSLSFHPNALGRTKTMLKNLGVDVAGRVRITPELFLNKVATLRVDIETSTQVDPDTGENYPPRNRIKAMKAGSSESTINTLLG